MLHFKTKVGMRGQIVIPKVIRENLGILENKTVVITVEDKSVKIIPSRGEDILKSWQEIAKKEGTDVKNTFIYGDKLYEEEFFQ
ncbi:AbrB/MazE/SpoVT family DNA-binding domain-containing protein [Candidatus Woesearchaeota archaeon]|nr:AbrB/MazE/SpoVT family DNA-binding domain-containing protein [Candidatus Woesearchaeota archaeon]